ncbi:MAG: aldehyde dehydrogenase [Ruminococcaceae bacterium]|nr:aldehyde dehydrogenase [Oscillospiraceae bacterium]
MNITNLINTQREYFLSGATRTLSFRLEALKKLKAAVQRHESDITEALGKDLGKHSMESYMCETGLVLEELSYHIKHLRKWIKDKRVKTPLAQFHGTSRICPEPYGVALIMSPWNYPVQLCLEPLTAAISAGNCAVVKPSAYVPHTSAVLAKLIAETFPTEYIAVVEGGREENQALLREKFDYIFFTGSVAVGKTVMEAASKHLTPVTLELGGKSPAIVDETANIPLAAKRIAFGKVINSGQTCVAPDYLLIHERVKDEFVVHYKKALEEFFPGGDLSEMPVMVNEKHFRRVVGLMQGENAVIGGGYDEVSRSIEPTVLDGITPDSPIMQEEIFGPVLPVMTYTALDECIDFIRRRPKPLALYLFTASADSEKRILNSCSFGGGCINDTIIHLTSPDMPFGGVGESGMGSYHGKYGFDVFTHYRSVIKKSTWIDLPMRYHPYTESKLGMIKKFLK